MAETTVQVRGGAQICLEAIGEPGDPAILLIGGAAWSMDWWMWGMFIDTLVEHTGG